MLLSLTTLWLIQAGSTVEFGDCRKNGRTYDNLSAWLASMDFDESEIRQRGQLTEEDNKIITFVPNLNGRMVLLFEPSPVQSQKKS